SENAPNKGANTGRSCECDGRFDGFGESLSGAVWTSLFQNRTFLNRAVKFSQTFIRPIEQTRTKRTEDYCFFTDSLAASKPGRLKGWKASRWSVHSRGCSGKRRNSGR